MDLHQHECRHKVLQRTYTRFYKKHMQGSTKNIYKVLQKTYARFYEEHMQEAVEVTSKHPQLN